MRWEIDQPIFQACQGARQVDGETCARTGSRTSSDPLSTRARGTPGTQPRKLEMAREAMAMNGTSRCESPTPLTVQHGRIRLSSGIPMGP